MNALRDTIQRLRLSDIEAMNALQESGIVSDEAIAVEDVAEADVERAARWLNINFGPGILF